jgi:hypothetical protein
MPMDVALLTGTILLGILTTTVRAEVRLQGVLYLMRLIALGVRCHARI